MYPDIQQRYLRLSPDLSNGGFNITPTHDYDHIEEDNFMLSFPTSSADLACKTTTYKRGGESGEGVSGGVSLVPQPCLYSIPVVVECDQFSSGGTSLVPQPCLYSAPMDYDLPQLLPLHSNMQ